MAMIVVVVLSAIRLLMRNSERFNPEPQRDVLLMCEICAIKVVIVDVPERPSL